MTLTRANALGDYANFFLHFGLLTGIAGGVLMTLGFPAVAGGLAVGYTLHRKFNRTPKLLDDFQDVLDEERARERKKEKTPEMFRKRGFERLYPEKTEPEEQKSFRLKVERWTRQAAQKMGLEEAPQLLILPRGKTRNKYDIGEEDDRKTMLRKFLLGSFNKHANAFAFTHEKGNVVLTDPLVQTLKDNELKGVVAHEVGHIAAGHTWFRNVMDYISTPTKLLTGLNQLFTIATSVKNIGLYAAARGLSTYATYKYAAHKGWDTEKLEDLVKIVNFAQYSHSAILAGLAVVFAAPEVLVAQSIHFATKHAIDLVEKRYSRQNEFQADRLAVQITENPKAMCTALQKIKREHLKAEPGFNYNEAKKPANDRTVLSDMFDRVRDLTKTHPNVERRCDAIMDVKLPSYAMPAPMAA